MFAAAFGHGRHTGQRYLTDAGHGEPVSVRTAHPPRVRASHASNESSCTNVAPGIIGRGRHCAYACRADQFVRPVMAITTDSTANNATAPASSE